MDIKLELLKEYVADYVCSNIKDFVIDGGKIADTVAIKMLREISEVVKNDEYSDFDAMEEIVCIFEKYKIDAGVRHDF